MTKKQKETFTAKEIKRELERRARVNRGVEPDENRPLQNRLECIHCGRPYLPHEGIAGLCETCLDGD